MDETLDRELEAAEAADLAFDRSATYEWCGHAINWPGQAQWLWVAILRNGNYVTEQAALIMMFIGSRPDIKELERRWHRDKEDVMDELSDFLAQFDDECDEAADALRVGTMIRKDIQASQDELEGGGGDVSGVPKKSQALPPMSSTFQSSEVLTWTPSDTASHTPKVSSSSHSSFTARAASS